ncbi:tetratricopeptide repeat protein [Cyclobacterium marinum]|uniref:tetratricopeptide repeat protein n=1 Tax=Cyclobacterium marinum TaxID=104 RepID=UPI0011EC10C0|nr:tetratricopeptide repeat protein [Cyclobacterium marinum]MBI0400294.1 tetratricopeptide repeat protein [Cyclobacterium marinum]
MYRFLFLLVCNVFSTIALHAQTPLLDAIKAGDLPELQQLVKEGADVNALDENGANPLMWAAYRADLEIVKWLVDNGADPFLKKGVIYLNVEKTVYYGNLTGIAAGEGKLEILQYLIEEVGIPEGDKEYNPETEKEDGWTAAQWADNSWISLNQRMKDLYGMGHREEATEYGEKAVLAAQKEMGKRHPHYAISLQNLAVMYQSLGRNTEAKQLYHIALDIEKEILGESHPEYASTLSNLGALYERIGYIREAESVYFQAAKIRKTQIGENDLDYAISLNSLAGLYESIGRYNAAEPLILKAMEIKKSQVGKKHIVYASSLNNLARLYESMGRYEEAEPLYMQAIGIRKMQLGDDHPRYADSLNGLARLYQRKGRYHEAELLMVKAIAILKTRMGDNHPDYAKSLYNLARLVQINGQYLEAEMLYKQALEINIAQLGKNHSDNAKYLSGLAFLYEKIGLYSDAEVQYWKAIGIWKRYYWAENHPDYAVSLNNLAGLYESLGNYAQAESSYKKAQQMYFHQLQSFFPSLSEKEKEQFLITFYHTFERFHSFALKRREGNPTITGNQFMNVLLLKGLLLRSTAEMREGVLTSGDTNAIRVFEDWQLLKRQWLQEFEMLLSERGQAGIAIETTLEKANTLEKELFRLSEDFSQATSIGLRYWGVVKDNLQTHEAAIELIRYRWYDKKWTDTVHYAALIVTPETEGHPHLVVLENGNELEERGAQSYQYAFATRGARRVTEDENPIPADSLYVYFWQPIQKALDSLGGTKKVYLSADGVYHTLNLQTLKNPETGQYLLETLDIERVGSTRDLVKKKKRHPNTNNAVLAGYPSYPASPEAVASALERYQRGQAAPVHTASRSSSNYGTYQTYRAINANRNSISPLPGTLAEVEQLTSIFDRVGITTSALLENAASEDVLQKVKSPRILHIATHGFFEPESEQQAEDLNRKMLRSGLGQETVTENPYLRCGLYLAGAETTLKNRGNPDFQRPEGQEDGILTAYEATLLDLRGTELVVLSACETGLGVTKNGEGVYGLQRAFQVAGAETVIFSLWKVADEQTQEMMGLFYQNWLQKDMTKRQAFKSAQQTIKEKYEDPYFWGAFMMIGG